MQIIDNIDDFITVLLEYVNDNIIPRDDSNIGEISCNFTVASKGTPINVRLKSDPNKAIVFYAERLFYGQYPMESIAAIAENIDRIVGQESARVESYSKATIPLAEANPKTVIVTSMIDAATPPNYGNNVVKQAIPFAGVTLYLKDQIDNNPGPTHAYGHVEFDGSDTDVIELWKAAFVNTRQNTRVEITIPDGITARIHLYDSCQFAENFYMFITDIYDQIAKSFNAETFYIIPLGPYDAEAFVVQNTTALPNDTVRNKIAEMIHAHIMNISQEIKQSPESLPIMRYSVSNHNFAVIR